jgi:hypothetical protein
MLLTVIAGLAIMAPPSQAATPRVSDEGHFFSADAVAKANQRIKDIQRLYGKDLLVETVPGVPATMERRFKELGKKEFFVTWAHRRAEDAGINGVYILISKNPGHLQIEVSRQLQNRGFSLDDQDSLVKKMSTMLGQKKNDAALLEAVNFVNAKFAAKLGKRTPSPTPVHAVAPQRPAVPLANREGPAAQPQAGLSPLGWLGIGLAVVAGIWILSAIFRALSGGGYGPGPAGPGGYGGGGGGFFSSLLGGLFGAATGMWLYNNFFGGVSHWGDSSQAYGGEPTSSDADAGGYNDSGSDFDSGDDTSGYNDSGADFDSGDLGGGDFGGDDFGGGDFGGGDA